MISVVIPARNAAGTIAATLASLVGDIALIGEILLIDDGSDDGTGRVATQAASLHALPLTITAGRFGGAGAARNAGLAQARGKHVFYLDADDEVISGGLTLLHDALQREPAARIAIGASVRRTEGRPDKTKIPDGYGADRRNNARSYLFNERQPIAMGSALIAAAEARDIRFPTLIGLDEDTCYWAALLTRLPVVTISEPVLLYHLDEARMADRFVSSPRATLLGISLELNRLEAFGIGRDVLQWRKAWIALRIARLLIMQRRFREAAGMMRAVQAHDGFRSGWKSIQYRVRIGAGRIAQSVGLCRPIGRRSAPGAQIPPRRTLILTCDPAFPPVSGGDLRNFQNARAAAEFGPVLLVSVRPPTERVPLDSRVRTAALTRENEPRAKSLVRWRTSAEMRIPRPALPRLLAIVRKFRPDTIIVEGALFALLKHLRPLTRRLILDMHNIESALAAHLRPAKSLLERLLPFAWSDPGRIQRLERNALTIVDGVWVCSDQDREKLRFLFEPDIPVDIVPNGIPRFEEMPASLAPLPGKDDGWPVMLFVGHLGYQPNIVAAERLALNILPLVRQKFPSARAILAGRYPKPAVQNLARLPGVELVTNPEDLSGLLLRSHFSVIPLSAGGGTRIKILEAMAWGLPVVATSLAAEGHGFTDKEEIVISDTDMGLANLIIALCSDPDRLERQRVRAYEQVRRRFGASAIESAVRKSFGLFDANV